MSLKKSRFIKGIILAPDNAALDGIVGEIKVDSSTGKIQVTLKEPSDPLPVAHEIITSSQTQTLTNKTLTSPVLDTGVSGSAIDIDGTLAANSDTKLASQKAVKTYVDAAVASKDQASEISYSNATSGLVATNVQTAIDEVDGNVDNLVTLSGVALDSTTLGTFTGTTIPDSSTIKSAIQSLETSHESHTGASSGVHGVAGSVVGTSDSQALTNKTIDADLNTISNIENADIKVGAAIARAKLASGTANRVVVNDATGVQVDAAAITASRALVSDANGIPTHSSTTSTEIGHLSGVTSAIQTQLDGKVDESGGTLTSGSVITPARLDVKQGTKASLTTYALTATNGQIVYATDTKEMFQVIDGLLEGIGGGEGVGGTDILFAQTFETAALTDFTQTGLSLSTSNPLHGEISALLTHQAGTSPTNDQLFKQVIPVDNKFRNQTMVLRLDVKSNASAGNVVINIYDETNTANIVASEQLQLSNDVNGTKNSVGFTIPETCASISYTITALPEAGSPVTRIDDIICELAETALLETAVEVPNVTSWQGYTPTFQGFGTPSAVEFEWRQVGENVEIRGKFTTGTTTAVEARVGLPGGLTSAGTGLIPSIQLAGRLARDIVNGEYNYNMLIESGVSYLTIGVEGVSRAGLTKQNASTIFGSGNVLSFFASVPCSGLSATTTKTIPLTQSGLITQPDENYQLNGFTYRTASTNTNILFFNDGTIANNNLSTISINNDSVLGSTFTIQRDGFYSFNFQAELGGTAGDVYLVKNSTTAVSANILSGFYENGAQFINSFAWSGPLKQGDVIRIIRSGVVATFTADARNYLSISYVGNVKQVSVNPNSKITIPTSELRFEGASARGTSPSNTIVKFDNIAKIRGDAFTVNNDPVLGTSIVMKKAGRLSVSASVYINSASGATYISRNQQVLTNVPIAGEQLSAGGSTSSVISPVAWSGDLSIGDVIRISTNVVPTANASNLLNLSFQEQDISVSVTNTLPQFSESDSSVRVTGGNGFTGQTRLFSNVIQNIGSDVQYTAASGQFRAMSSGIYNITYQEESSVSSTSYEIYVYVNETLIAIANDRINTAATLTRYPIASIQLYLSEGDIVTGRVSATGSFPSVTSYSSMTISKVGKPNVTGVDVTPFVNVPQPVSQSFYQAGLTLLSTTGTIRFPLAGTTQNGQGVFSYNESTGVFTLLKRADISISTGLTPTTIGNIFSINLNGVEVGRSNTNSTANYRVVGSASFVGNVGDSITITTAATIAQSAPSIAILATALSDQILTAPETFSTDTASLTYANIATYTPSTLANAPVGTYITFTYAGGGNARSQTTGLNRPTQTDADMNANGILLYTRVFSVGSSSSQPAAIAIQIGKGMKGKTIDLYKSAGKLISGSIDSIHVGTDTQRGLAFQSYDEKTGILYLDAGLNLNGSATTDNKFIFNDNLTQTSGYLVINASKNPALTGLNVLQPRIATLSEQYVSGTGSQTTVASYSARRLNTLSGDTSFIVNSGSFTGTGGTATQVVLQAGTYSVDFATQIIRTNTTGILSSKMRLQNITAGATLLIGTSAQDNNTSGGQNDVSSCILKGTFSISSESTIELQQRANVAGEPFGIAVSFGDNEVYLVGSIQKIK